LIHINILYFHFNPIQLTTATNRRIQQKYIPTPPVGSSDAEIQLKKDVQRQNMLDRMTESEDRINARRNYREQAQLIKERELEEALARSQQEKQAKQSQREQEERLASELERFKLDQLRDAKMRQQLRESR
jgi:hypothetical protein